MRGVQTLREIHDQPEAWAAALEGFAVIASRLEYLVEARCPDEVVFTGCGSSYYLSLTAACAFQTATGVPARAVPASEILQFPESVFAREAAPLLVATSRSGTTTETVRAARLAVRRGIPVVALTCAAKSDLARQAELALVSSRGAERSVVMTKSFSSMLLLGLLLAAACGGDRVLRKELGRLPALGRRALKVALPLMQDVAAGAPKVVFLGGGPMYGVACEAMLKLTEMAQRPTVVYHPLEFRHGPIAAAGPGTVAVLLGSRAGARLEAALVRDLRRQSVSVLRLRDGESGVGEADVDVTLPSGLSDAARAVLYLPFVQALAYWRAMGAGFDPDRPVRLTQVVQL